MGSLSSNNKHVQYLLRVTDNFTKHLKDKKGKTVLNAFIKIINDCNRKLNKLWIDQGR